MTRARWKHPAVMPGIARRAPDPMTMGLPPTLTVPPPKNAARVARAVSVGFLLTILLLAIAPWQQNVPGIGRVVAFRPDARQQRIEATISGVVAEIFVREGEQVVEGQPLLRLSDNDPAFLERLAAERTAVELRLAAQEERRNFLEERVGSLRRSLRAQLEVAEAEVRIAREGVTAASQELEAARAAVEVNDRNLERQRELAEQGLASDRERELAELSARQSGASLRSAEAGLRAAQGNLRATQSAVERIRANADAEISTGSASLQDAETDIAETRASLTRLQTGIARQEAQVVRAPREGTIMRVLARQGGEQVSQGETLALLVPDTEDRAVELVVDGNDAPLIHPGVAVRLQFEGWPGVQIGGWPQVAVGTFGGRVAFVDAADRGDGTFRAVVVADPEEPAWPPARSLRQGLRAKGWFLLREVRLGYELWRRMNGFPASLPAPEEER